MTLEMETTDIYEQREMRGKNLQRLNKRLFPYILLFPTIVLMVGLILYPVLSALNISLHDVPIMAIGRDLGPFTLDNYTKLFSSPQLWPAVRVSLLYVVIVTVADYLIGLGTALLLNNDFRGRTLARLIIIIPWAVPMVVATNIFWWIFNKSYGLINYALVSQNIIDQSIDWFTTPIPALIAISVTTLWKGYPMFTVMFLAGLQSIPKDLYDATKVDGANAWQSFIHITLPALRGVSGIALLINSLWVFREFTAIFVLTGGGPVNFTRTLAVWTYTEAFGNLQMGYAGAIGVFTMLIAVVASVFFVRFTLTSDFYD